jgi:hypothetical protein
MAGSGRNSILFAALATRKSKLVKLNQRVFKLFTTTLILEPAFTVAFSQSQAFSQGQAETKSGPDSRAIARQSYERKDTSPLQLQ